MTIIVAYQEHIVYDQNTTMIKHLHLTEEERENSKIEVCLKKKE